MLRAVLLDVDGTLVDSNDAHAQAWAFAFQHFGHQVAFEQVRPLIGKGGDKLVSELAGIDVESSEGKQLEAFRSQVFTRDYLPNLRAFPQARELLLRMREDNLKLVVATSAKRVEMEALLDIARVRDIIHACTSSDDADESKPDPDIIEAARAKADAKPRECLLLGDTPYDIAAALRADVRTVALRSGGWADTALDDAVAIYDGVADLFAHYERSPFK